MKKMFKLMSVLLCVSSTMLSCADEQGISPTSSNNVVATSPTSDALPPVLCNTCGYQGRVYEYNNNYATISQAKLTFESIETRKVYVTYADRDGGYKILLPTGKYKATATKDGYVDVDANSPGYSVVTGWDGYQTGNFFMVANSN